MPDVNFDIADILLLEYRIASITAYNRLESSPRAVDFDRSLRSEVRDPLWMLTRQWQFGEFQGEDAATAVTTQVLGEHTAMSSVNFPGNSSFPFDETIPLETTVESEKLLPDLFLAVQMARYFIKLMKSASLEIHLDRFLDQYPLQYVPDKNDYEGIQLLNAVEGKMFDGFLLLKDITTSSGTGTVFSEWLNTEGLPATFLPLAESLKNWVARNYNQPLPNTGSAWLSSNLEYQFAVGTSQQEKTLVAEGYAQGHLDWHSFDLNLPSRSPDTPDVNVAVENLVSFIPSLVSFKGMPNPRFWMMEDSQTDFGKIDTSPTGLLHLLFAEFGLTCSNDWFNLPYPLSINNLCEIKGIVVTDVFGEHIFIHPANRATETNWQRWAMFHHAVVNDDDSFVNKNKFYLAPTLTKSLEGSPLEQVNFLRDEMANMVWAIENTVPSHGGKGVSGNEMALREEPVVDFSPVGNAPIRYVLGTTVPDNWIPFIPVHMEGSDTEIRLQRATMPGAKGALGVMLKEKAAPYYINEEEIPRSGVIVKRSFQRTRWLNGKTYLWIGRRKEAGKGEGWSNLEFDQIEDILE
jgi:hypothetical protein